MLLALAALLAPPAEASRTSVWEPTPPASIAVPRADAAGLLASLAPAATADAEPTEPPLFNLGDVVLADIVDTDATQFDLGPLTLVDLNLLRGPPPSYPETRVGGFELLRPFRVGASPSLSLWARQACGFSCGEVASDSRYDPWGLEVHKSLGCPPGQTCMGALEYENITTVGPRRSAMPPTMRAVPPRSRGSYTLGFVKATGNALISPGSGTRPCDVPRSGGLLLLAEQRRGEPRYGDHGLGVHGRVCRAWVWARSGRSTSEAAMFSEEAYAAGPNSQDVRAGETYSEEAGSERAAPGTARADFRDTFGIEKVELKFFNPRSRSYVVEDTASNGLRDRLNKYLQQLLGYDRSEPTPINVLEIQLIRADQLTFNQDLVLRGFMADSLKQGVQVEVYDYKTGGLVMKPPEP